MAEYNVKINVKTDTGYDQLYPKSKSDIIDFDKTSSNLSSTNVEAAIKEVNTKASTNKTNIGTLSSLKTDSKTNLVGAINEIDSHANTATTTANTNKTNIGTLSSLKTSVKNSIVNAINWLYDNVVRKTSVIDNLDDIVANQADGMVAGAKAVAELNDKKNIFLEKDGVNPSIVLTHDDMIDEKVYNFIAVSQTSIDNTSYKQEITAKLNSYTIGINGDNANLMSVFSGQCVKGDTLSISSYKTGGNYRTFFTRIILIPE